MEFKGSVKAAGTIRSKKTALGRAAAKEPVEKAEYQSGEG